jgi:hypothetical protein
VLLLLLLLSYRTSRTTKLVTSQWPAPQCSSHRLTPQVDLAVAAAASHPAPAMLLLLLLDATLVLHLWRNSTNSRLAAQHSIPCPSRSHLLLHKLAGPQLACGGVLLTFLVRTLCCWGPGVFCVVMCER